MLIPDGATAAPERWFPTSEALAGYLAANPVRDAVVLVKGSRGIQMEKVLDRL